MSWNVIRQATGEDKERLENAAVHFCARHGCSINGEDPILAAEACGYAQTRQSGDLHDCARMRRLWLGCVRRALRHPQATGISYGCVGYSVK